MFVGDACFAKERADDDADAAVKRLACCEQLVARGADGAAVDAQGRTPLHAAAAALCLARP